MPNPRRKISRSKRDKRRQSWAGKMNMAHLSNCENCGEKKIPHNVCPHCGYYKGRAIYTPEATS
jgi:large subunit ribosomal protein L32